jgi:DUF1365 family protein
MGIATALVTADVMHKRLRPRMHGFTYKVYYLCFALGQIEYLSNRLLSLDRWNLLSFHRRDHGARDGSDLAAWIGKVLADYNIAEANGAIILLTMPRVLGYVFNPVSFWFCLDKSGDLRAVLSEVRNTFGEYHSYISFHSDHRLIRPDDWLQSEKIFHVSPFMDVRGYYRFRFICRPDKVFACVNYFDEQGLMLTTSVGGNPAPLTTFAVFKNFFCYPLITLKVIGLIHWEAVRLLLKGVRYRPKPPPPLQKITT